MISWCFFLWTTIFRIQFFYLRFDGWNSFIVIRICTFPKYIYYLLCLFRTSLKSDFCYCICLKTFIFKVDSYMQRYIFTKRAILLSNISSCWTRYLTATSSLILWNDNLLYSFNRNYCKWILNNCNNSLNPILISIKTLTQKPTIIAKIDE